MKVLTMCSGLLVAVALQGQVSVRGKVVGEKGEPLEYVNVVAMSLPDSTFIKGVKTDARGEFALDQLPKTSYLVFSSLGYESVSLPIGRGEDLRVVLKESSTSLGGVVITRQRMQMRAGGYTYSFKDSTLPKAKKATELLELLPHISLDEKGELTLLARKVGIIYVDGIPVRDIKELESIPADQIDRVEVDYTSATSEGAEVEGGSLRIYLKKPKDGGYYGNVSASGQVAQSYGWTKARSDAYFSGRWGRVAVSGSVDLGKTLSRGDYAYETTNKSTGAVLKTEETFRSWYDFGRYRINLGYDFSDRHKLVSSASLNHSVAKPEYMTIDLSNSMRSYRLGRNPSHSLQWFGKYSWQMDKQSKLEVNLDYLFRDNEERTTEQTPVLYSAWSKTRSHMYRLKPTYEKQWSGGSKLSVGADAQWIRQDEEVGAGLVPTLARVQKPALYASFASRVGKLSYDVGMRLQHNDMKVRQGSEEYRHRHTGLYPNLSLMYAIDPQRGHIMNLSVQHTLGTIPYSAISGYRNYSGPHYYEVGNPSLDVQTQTVAMLMASLWGKLNAMAVMAYVQNPIYNETFIDPSDGITTYSQPHNGRHMTFWVASLEGNLNLTKWWHTKTSLMYRVFSADAGVQVSNQNSWMLMHTSNFTFSKSSGMGFRLHYEPSLSYLFYRGESFLSFTGHAYKAFWGDKLETRLDFKLFGHERSGTMETDLVRRYTQSLSKVPYVGLTLTYRFRGGKKIKSVEAKPLQSYETVSGMAM